MPIQYITFKWLLLTKRYTQITSICCLYVCLTNQAVYKYVFNQIYEICDQGILFEWQTLTCVGTANAMGLNYHLEYELKENRSVGILFPYYLLKKTP